MAKCGIALIAGLLFPLVTAWTQEDVTLRRVAGGFAFPTSVVSFPDDPNRLLVLEQYTGLVKLVDHGVVQPGAFLDLEDRIATTGIERGLMCLTFHPDFAENGFFYVSFTNTAGDNEVRRYSISSNPDIADAESGVTLLQIDQPNEEHNGGTMVFGPEDGYLYMSVGDGGFFTPDSAQDLTSPLGKILRIDVGDGSSGAYTIPEDNPFAGHATNDERIWLYGLRNPWRFSIDAPTGDMYIGDVGEFTVEEVSYIPGGSAGGANLGWPQAEGFACRGGSGSCGDDAGFTPPVHDFRHRLFRPSSVTGGNVYRGDAIPSYQGLYFFADYPSGRIWTLRMVDGDATAVTERSSQLDPPGDGAINAVSSFGEDSAGELYVVEYEAGEIYKLVNNEGLADIDYSGSANAVDVQLVINAALGVGDAPYDADIVISGEVDAVDIQQVIIGVLGG